MSVSVTSSENLVIDRADPNAATRMLWNHLARPVIVRDAARAVIGLAPEFIRRIEGAMIATSPEAEGLLDAMPEILRNLAITIEQRAERCQGEVRGPVLWSETVAARAGTAGATDVFICLTSRRAYDTSQNRVLVAALATLRRAAADADPAGVEPEGTRGLARARENGDTARRFLEHRTLRDVTSKRPSRRDLGKAAAGRRSRRYQAAVDLLAQARDPLVLDHLLPFVDAHTAWQHWLIVTLVGRLRAGGIKMTPLLVSPNGDLRSGPLTYRHSNVAQRTGNPLHGVIFDRHLIDVPRTIGAVDVDAEREALSIRAHGHVPFLVTGPGDLDRVIDAIVSTGT